MRVFSRHMPPRPDHAVGWFATALCCGLLLALAALPGLAWWPFAIVFPGILAAMTAYGWRRDARVAEARVDESICVFARSFDRRDMDPWIVRAVYEEFSCRFPVRRTDRFVEDLLVDEEDFIWDVLAIIERTGLHLDKENPDPRFENIATVEDLVFALHTLPRVSARSA